LGQDVRRRAEWRGVRDLGRAHKAEAFNFGFDSALLTIDSVTVNSALFDFLPDGAGSAVGDTWPNIGFDSFVNNPASGMFSIATISPTARGTPGTANLSIMGSSKFYSATAVLSATLLPGTVNIVPVPAAVWLLGSGLMGLIGIARKKAA
jgi:hypothetical protein